MADELPREQASNQAGPSPSGNSTQSSTDWRASIPSDLRGERFWENVKDLPGLIKGYADGIKYQGQSIRIPGPNATIEETNRFYDKLRPKNAAEYQLDHSTIPTDVTYNQNLEDQARAKFHELGLTPNQATGLYNWFLQADTAARQAHTERYVQGQQDLDKEWGTSAEANHSLAQRGLAYLVGGNPEHPLVKWLDSSGEAYNPVLIKFFHEIGRGLGEDFLAGMEDEINVASPD